ncbi:MAG: gephyrin-like molybdotransferase Glp [Candidatus Ratteibacteria bacterium]
MVTIEEAKRLIWENTPVLGKEKIDIIDSLGRVIGEDIISYFDIPSFDRSAMDGFAVLQKDTIGATFENPIYLEVVDEIKAGESKDLIIEKGKAVSIMTGAKIPKNCDSVIKIEDTEEIIKDGKRYIKIKKELKKGENISKKGEDIKKGNIVIKKGTFIDSSVFSFLAYLGKKRIIVYKKPSVAILSTGDEIRKVGERLKEGQIYDSNSYSIYALTKKYGGNPKILGISKDTPEILDRFIKKGLLYDLFIISGGVSEGKYDIVVDILEKNKVKMIFHKVAVKPGKPTFFGKKGRKIIFGLPGYPVSTYINFENLVKVSLYKMTGRSIPERFKFTGILKEDVENKTDRDEFLRVIAEVENADVYITPYPSQKSGVLSSVVYSNAILYLKKGEKKKKGERVIVEYLEK